MKEEKTLQQVTFNYLKSMIETDRARIKSMSKTITTMLEHMISQGKDIQRLTIQLEEMKEDTK